VPSSGSTPSLVGNDALKLSAIFVNSIHTYLLPPIGNYPLTPRSWRLFNYDNFSFNPQVFRPKFEGIGG
jgi:hypothetical protein